MSLRINLLKGDELREAGALSQGFIVRVGIMIASGVLLVGVGLVVLHSHNVKQSLVQARARFRKIDPLYQDMKAMQEDLEANEKLIRELDSLAKSRMLWHKTLMDLQAIIPETVALKRLDVRESMKMAVAKAWEKKPPVPARVFNLQLAGNIHAEVADAVVVRFVRDLRSSEAFEPLMESVKLKGQGLQRESGSRSGPNRWVFGIIAEGKPREMKMVAAGVKGAKQTPKEGPQ